MASQPEPNSEPPNPPLPSFLTLSDTTFLSNLKPFSKHKERSHSTYHNIHLPELSYRLNLSLELPKPPTLSGHDPFALRPDTTNKSKIEAVYLGNSMLERLKTTGKHTELEKLGTDSGAWNAGCGGDKNEHILYRLSLGMYTLLKQPCENKDIKLWILASGTNNLHAKRPFREADVQSYRLLLEACLRIEPRSTVLACDMFYRKDILDEVVERSNELLKSVVEDVNKEIGDERVVWVEARGKLGKENLVDHVHLNGEGYEIWGNVLWPHVQSVLRPKDEGAERKE